MQRREFLKTSALAGTTFLIKPRRIFAETADANIEVLLDAPLGTISPFIYSHFTEELGAVIYDGIWVGEKSKIPNQQGIRTAVSTNFARSRHLLYAGPGAASPIAMTGVTA